MALRSRDPRAVSVLEAVDGFAPLRNGIRRVAAMRGEWAGIPMPLSGMSLTIEPSYPHAEALSQIGREEEDLPPDVKLRNTFWSHRRRCYILVWEEGGKVCWGPGSVPNQLGKILDTLGAADAWGIEQEANAVNTLGTLLRHRQFKQYLLTGCFMERSKRSGVSYLFRRLRPTIAIRSDEKSSRILCALCLHPIGYYGGSWAGAMTPTDDVIAHLMLMRGDEHMFWKRSNQHAPDRPEAGIG